MAHKRPCEDQLPNEVSAKHPRQMGEGDHIFPQVDVVSLKETSVKHYPSGEGSFLVNGLEGQEVSSNGRCPGSPDGNEEDNDVVPRSLSLSPWAASSTSEEDYTVDLVAPLPFNTEYFTFDRAVSSPLHSDSLYYSLPDYPPRKSIPVGPDYQADIPALSKSSFTRDEDDVLAGNSVIPRNDLELPPYNGRNDCDCADMGSVRCVREHIMEAREKLMINLGQEAFIDLGFCEMGEVVAEKWSKDEQQLFHKAIYCNPVSSGKNFWNVLSALFPSRTKMEIVSYYFNVFMLQKRAEQNRHAPMNVDSDNDEWQLSDEDGFDPGEKTEEEEDSAVESPVCHDDDVSYMSRPNNINRHMDYPFDDLGSHGDIISKFECHSGIDLLEKRHDDDLLENNVHDGSYTSSDSGPPAQLQAGNPDCGREWQQDFILEPCDAKVWNGYSTCSKDQIDFLPTCSMIQEVFGDGALDSDISHVKRR